jgi:hypothetical protein
MPDRAGRIPRQASLGVACPFTVVWTLDPSSCSDWTKSRSRCEAESSRINPRILLDPLAAERGARPGGVTRHLLAEHDYLDRQILLPAPGKPDELKQTNEGHVEEGERHTSAMTCWSYQRKSRWVAWMVFSAPTGRPQSMASACQTERSVALVIGSTPEFGLRITRHRTVVGAVSCPRIGRYLDL